MSDSVSAKICGVCGDKALAKNFGALSCESCRAFFRRNAKNINVCKCVFGENKCEINVRTRKFCRKCRLMKCIRIGMRQEWIFMVDKKQIRRVSEEGKPVSAQSSSAGVSPNSSPPETQELESLELDINDTIDEEIITNIMQIEKHIDNDENNNKNDLISELTVHHIARPMPSNSEEFNDMESNRLIELFKALDIMKSQNKNTPEVTNIDHTCVSCLMITRLETEITNLVTVSKCLNGFNSLCENDQISLLKFGSPEIFFLRLILKFDFDNHNLFFVLNDQQTTLVNLNLFKHQTCSMMYDYHFDYLTKMGKEWESDSLIIDLLTAVILFNPNRPKLINRNMIKLQQQIYMYLLQRYLLLKYRSESDSKEKFLRLLSIFHDLDILNKHRAYGTSDKELQMFSPLVREVFDTEA